MNLLITNVRLAQGQALQRQGRLAEAAATLREVLRLEPRNGDALHLLGVTLGQMGRAAEAVDLLSAAVRVQPANPVMHANLANALGEIARHKDAVKSYDRALALDANLAPAYRGRGLARMRLGQSQEALADLSLAARLAPRDPQSHADLGVVELSLGRHGEALASLERALALRPHDAMLLANRGSALRALGRPEEALASYDQSLALAPDRPQVHYERAMLLLGARRLGDALAGLDRTLALTAGHFAPHFHRGMVLALLERHEDALASFDRALALEPQSAQAHNNRGVELEQLGRSAAALEAFASAVACKPDDASAYTNAANTLKSLGRFEEALGSFERALAIEPEHALARWSKSLLKLTLGEFDQGWPLYEARLQVPQFSPYQRSFDVPRWSGSEPLSGKTILVHAEQGLGDALQFARYIPLLEARGAQVIFEVPAELGRLLRTLPMRGTLLVRGEPPPPLDYYCPLLSLPLAFQTRADSIPGGVPYIAAEAAAVQGWRERLGALPGLKIGLNWQGHVGAEKQPWVRGRSFALACAAPLAGVPGVSLVSLQKGAAAGQRTQVEFGNSLAQLTDPQDLGADALLETAALMSALDLVITSDTSVAHLAGALGVPVWVVLHSVPDWRWRLTGSGSAWYPSMRLYRQRVAGDWPEVFERVAQELRASMRDRSGAAGPESS